MAEVVIVSRTQMGHDNVCIGGYDLNAQRNVRLLTTTGENQPATAQFQIGEVWNMSYTPKQNVAAPHFEDVCVQTAAMLNALNDVELRNVIYQNCQIVQGNLSALFGGTVNSPPNAAAYISGQAVPSHSVCFWIPNADLHHLFAFDKHKYHYVDQTHDTRFAYVGIPPPINVIPAGSIVRMSLARWWAPSSASPVSCYLQVSGWY